MKGRKWNYFLKKTYKHDKAREKGCSGRRKAHCLLEIDSLIQNCCPLYPLPRPPFYPPTHFSLAKGNSMQEVPHWETTQGSLYLSKALGPSCHLLCNFGQDLPLFFIPRIFPFVLEVYYSLVSTLFISLFYIYCKKALSTNTVSTQLREFLAKQQDCTSSPLLCGAELNEYPKEQELKGDSFSAVAVLSAQTHFAVVLKIPG